jgi:putative colanic acid biosynthesis glycosyltransferase
MILFSVVTIVRNDLPALQATAKSVLGQECSALEWLVIDGASTDGTADYLPELQRMAADNSVVLRVCSERDRGIFDAMNKGLRRASGQFILFLNAGDVFATPAALSIVKAALDRATEIEVYSDTDINIIICAVKLQMTGGRYYIQQPRKLSYLRHSLPASHQGIFVHRDLHHDIVFDESLSVAADYDAICRMYVAANLRALYLNEVVTEVWRGVDSNSIRHPFLGVRDMARTQRRVFKLSSAEIAIGAMRRLLPMLAYYLVEVPIFSGIVHRLILAARPLPGWQARGDV